MILVSISISNQLGKQYFRLGHEDPVWTLPLRESGPFLVTIVTPSGKKHPPSPLNVCIRGWVDCTAGCRRSNWNNTSPCYESHFYGCSGLFCSAQTQLRPTQPPSQSVPGIKRSRRETEPSLPSSAQVKNSLSCESTSAHALTALCLTFRHRASSI